MRGIIMQGESVDDVHVVDGIEITGQLHAKQVRVEVRAASVCGSDLSLVKGKYYMPTPIIPGHEAAGIVSEVGAAVTGVEVGDHIAISTLNNCGSCPLCAVGQPTLCGTPGGLTQPYVYNNEPINQFANVSAFAQETVIEEVQAVRIPKEVPFEAASLIGCGVITGAGAVFNRAKVSFGDTVAVIGAGGVGLNVIQAAALSGARQIIVLDTAPAKESLAKTFGATDFIHVDGKDFDSVAAVKSLLPLGVDHTFEVVGIPALIQQSINMTRPGGNIVAVGVAELGASVEFVPFTAYQNKNIMYVRYGGARPHNDFPMIADLYLRGKFRLDELISHTAPLDGIGEAFASIEAGQGDVRTVLLPN